VVSERRGWRVVEALEKGSKGSGIPEVLPALLGIQNVAAYGLVRERDDTVHLYDSHDLAPTPSEVYHRRCRIWTDRE
jgi:hypothetical protein